MTYTYKQNSYSISSSEPLSDDSIYALSEAITTKQTNKPKPDALSGRTSVKYCEIKNIGKVVIKQYKRGGLIGKIVKETYLRVRRIRSQNEFDQLLIARNAGINVPNPVASFHKGFIFYKCWLVTREIESAKSLVEISGAEKNRASVILKNFSDVLDKLVNKKIHHIDLHPGNLIVNESNEIYLIDFDKARHFKGSKKSLRYRYIQRWNRSVRKHKLSDTLLLE